jgi:hypothetical protein
MVCGTVNATKTLLLRFLKTTDLRQFVLDSRGWILVVDHHLREIRDQLVARRMRGQRPGSARGQGTTPASAVHVGLLGLGVHGRCCDSGCYFE